MKVLLDECLPRDLKQYLHDHDSHTVSELGWTGKKNGKLIELASKSQFNVFLTVAKSIAHQQS